MESFNYVQKKKSAQCRSKNVIHKMCLETIYLIYKKLSALDYLQWLICHKTKPNQTISRLFTHSQIVSVLFLKIWFTISHLFAHSLNDKQFYLTHRQDAIGATTPGQSVPWCNGNEKVLYIPKSTRVGASSSDCLISCPGHSQSMYSTVPDDWCVNIIRLCATKS